MKGPPRRVALAANVDPAAPKASGVRAHTLQLWRSLADQGFSVLLLGKGAAATPGFVPVTKDTNARDVRFTIALFRSPPLLDAVLHAQYPIYALPWILRGHPRTLCVLHGDNIRAIESKRGRLVGWLYGALEGLALRRCARIVAVSDEVAAAYAARWPAIRGRMQVIPLEPDPQMFQPRRVISERVSTADSPLILFVGRLRKDKRPELVLQAFARLRGRVVGSRLWILGDGNERPALESLARSLGVLDSVTFYGEVPRETVARIMSGANVLALTSAYESGPLVVAEARLCGLRVVATDVGRVREFRDRFGGVEVVNGDASSIADGLERAVLAGPLVPPLQAYNDISVDEFASIYSELLSPERPAFPKHGSRRWRSDTR